MDYFNEAFTLRDPLILDPHDLITESVWAEDYFREELENGVKKKNIFQKMWAILKKFWAIISAKCREVSAWFGSIFHTKKVEDKTLDQIAEIVFSDLKDQPSIKHMRLTYDNDQQIRMNIIGNTIKKQFSDPKIVGHDKKDRPYQQATMLAFHIIKQPHLLDPLIEFLTVVREKVDSPEWSTSRIQKAIDAVWAGTGFGMVVTISMEEWTILNERIQKLQNALQLVDDDTFNDNPAFASKYANAMNQLVSLGGYMQKGINTIADGMRQVYELDGKYHNKITAENFREKLPLFVRLCVEGNVPSKYIHHAVRQICDVSINAKVDNPNVKADENKTLTGNGRFVIFPGAEALRGKVIKVAYNGLGARGNRNEFVVWDKVKDIPEIADELYHVEGIGDEHNYVILADRCKPVDDYKQTVEWNKKMKQMCLDKKVGFIIRCNSGGFGERPDGKVICIDYGNVHRTDR